MRISFHERSCPICKRMDIFITDESAITEVAFAIWKADHRIHVVDCYLEDEQRRAYSWKEKSQSLQK